MNSIKNQQESDYQISSQRQNSSSFQNSLCVKNEKKAKLKLKKQRIYKQKKKGNWTDEQEQKFMKFILPYLNIFQSKQQRRSQKIFKEMAKYIKTRSPEQCRSHHQKYELRFKGPSQIIQHIQDKLGKIIPDAKTNQQRNQYIIDQQNCKVQQIWSEFEQLTIKIQFDVEALYSI